MHPAIEQNILQSRLYIERNLAEGLNGEVLADQAYLSYFHFHHQFKSSTGESVWQYVKRLRMEKASFLLRYTSLPVTDISFEVGFETTASFSKAFKAWYGYSPNYLRGQFLKSELSALPHKYDWNQVKSIRLQDQVILSFRSEGIYHFPEGYFKWQQLIGSLAEANVALIGKSPDQPGITPTDKLRWDTAIPDLNMPTNLKKELDQQQLLFEDKLPGGNYLIVPFVGFGRPLTTHLPALLAFLRTQGMEWRAGGYFFQVLRQHAPNNVCVTDLFIPIL